MEHKTHNKEKFHDKLMRLMDEYSHEVYRITKIFPKEEIFGITSQLRRSALSVPLNYIEGYARISDKYYKQFLRNSFGSLKEAQYLLRFALEEKILTKKDFDIVHQKGEEIAKMLWSTMQKLK